MRQVLQPEFFDRPTEQVARELLGKMLVQRVDERVLSGIIVETEAYLPEIDEASHTYRGKTARNAAMFGEPGIVYVYKIYGIHHCLNFVTEAEGVGSAVLIRALEPVDGIEEMQKRRGVADVKQLCNGPGKLAAAFGLTTSDSFASACSPNLYLQPGREIAGRDIVATTRIGITKSADLPLRFYVRDSPFVSKPAATGRSRQAGAQAAIAGG